jgi:hypothetical protein
MAYRQAQERKKHLIKTYKKTKNNYGAGVWFDDHKGFYIKYTPSNTPGYTKALRRLSNRKVRKAKEFYNHSSYKKLYDYWWTLF